jgi:hypothetical protein
MKPTAAPDHGLVPGLNAAALSAVRRLDEWLVVPEPEPLSITVPSSWDEQVTYCFSMTEALFYERHPHAVDRVLDDIDREQHRDAVRRVDLTRLRGTPLAVVADDLGVSPDAARRVLSAA